MVTALVMLFERQTADAQQQMRTDLVADLVAGRGDRAELTTAARAYGLDPARPFCLLALVGEDAGARRALALSAHAAVGVARHRRRARRSGRRPRRRDRRRRPRLVGLGPHRSSGSHDGRGGRAAGRRGRCAGGVHRGRPDGPRDGRARSRRNRCGSRGPGFRGSRRRLGARRGRLRAPDPRDRCWSTTPRGAPISCGTVEAYFAAGGSPRHTATTLHVHVNTVAQRLERVAALLGATWQRPDRALELQLALRLRRLMPR